MPDFDVAKRESTYSKHPKQKRPITPITDAELQVPRKTIDRKILADHLHLLEHDVAPGLGYM